jgi:demethylmenaquinone methyltransferase/2-methoxy-6-polyprenyl-1,4-benzoquinol methylase
MQDPTYVKEAFGKIAGRYVVTNHVLSLGIDVLWRKRVARTVAGRKPKRVLDVATGSGDLAAEIARLCPEAIVVGADFCAPMLAEARKRGLGNLVVADGLRLPFEDGEFDVVTVGFGLRNMADWALGVREMARVLRPGGLLVVLDFSLPESGIRRALYRFYLHQMLPKVAGLLTGKRDAYEYLGGTIERFPSGEAMREFLTANGFAVARAKSLSFGVASVYEAEKGGA